MKTKRMGRIPMAAAVLAAGIAVFLMAGCGGSGRKEPVVSEKTPVVESVVESIREEAVAAPAKSGEEPGDGKPRSSPVPSVEPPGSLETTAVAPGSPDTPTETPAPGGSESPGSPDTPAVAPGSLDTPAVTPGSPDTPAVTPGSPDTPAVTPGSLDTPIEPDLPGDAVTPGSPDTPAVAPDDPDTPTETPAPDSSESPGIELPFVPVH